MITKATSRRAHPISFCNCGWRRGPSPLLAFVACGSGQAERRRRARGSWRCGGDDLDGGGPMARLQIGRRRAVWRLHAGLLAAATFAGGGAARARHPARVGYAATVASRASTRRRGCVVCSRGGWLSSPRSVGGMATEVAVAGRPWRKLAGGSGEVLFGSNACNFYFLIHNLLVVALGENYTLLVPSIIVAPGILEALLLFC